ncbi:MAG: polysaccharide biosynthesis protein, partial [Pseudomonadales bacterium]
MSNNPGWADTWSRRRKQAIAVAADCTVIPLALWSAIALRLGQLNPEVAQFWPAFVVAGLVCVPVFGGLGLYRHVIRHMGNHAIWAVFKGATITAIAVAAVAYMVPLKGFPRSVPIIFWLLITLYVSGTRYAMRSYLHWQARRVNPREPVIIFGAGSKGVELARLLNEQERYDPIAFVDDNRKLQKQTINGLYVYAPVLLERLLKEAECHQVFVAVNSTAAEERRRIIEYLEPYGVRVRLIPDLVEIVSGRQKLEDLRDVELDDLLGRDQVEPLPHLLKGSVFGRRVMVTGAGGSIGSELCRQILQQSPESLVLLDQSEYGLYEIQRELKHLARDLHLEVPVTPLLGSVGNQAYMCRMLEQHGIETLYHAAAYKHVGLVERNAIQGLKNNTFGTLHTAQAAMDSGVKD